MRFDKMGIAPEGIPCIGLCALTTLILALIGLWPLALLFLVLTWFSCHFFRDPERIIPKDENIAVSPADGRIIHVDKKQDPISGEMLTRICIFMNVLNVHVNRAPLDAKIEDIKYISGKYLNASWDKASEDNERCIYALKDEQDNKWTMVQIAGLIARRIVCRVQVGDDLKRGERYGLIRFGSRVDLYIPDNYTANVAVGDEVFAGQSIIAKIYESK